MSDNEKLLPCPKCGRPKTNNDIHGGFEEWVPTFYDPDSGGEPLYIECECGYRFSFSHEYKDFVEAWNKRA